ncbi:uncharacterized protein LY79DRAFT_670887 [Colletotrichum navitas]|uniref:Uncharacterized protein n=1 Tax=Colletotrichum navitas TaxID=681940 RepID=A0AAD8PX58_9PEZI|nr:uncharacterized protein LY79DRAFT_670887 [Colletotrichum navitas]KAK1585691.1 hypothetical protein LY79DRAFT_670887 [Colletotrichum navitas]
MAIVSSSWSGHNVLYVGVVTRKAINIGVQAWMECKDTFDFPQRMSVSTSGSMQFTDINRLDVLNPGEGPGLLEKYEDITLPGFDNFPELGSALEYLVMLFDDCVEKCDIAAVPKIWDSTAMTLDDTMDVPVFFVTQAYVNTKCVLTAFEPAGENLPPQKTDRRSKRSLKFRFIPSSPSSPGSFATCRERLVPPTRTSRPSLGPLTTVPNA